MNNLKIRKANVEDTNLLSVLSAVTFYEAFFEDDDQKDIANHIVKDYGAEQIKSEIEDKNSIFLIAELNGKAIGFAKLRENSKPEFLKDKNTIELHRLFLMERVWRKGIGKVLIEKCLSEAKQKGYESMWVATWQENIKAQAFYKKLGFRKVGEFQYNYESRIAVNYVFFKEVW